MEIHFRYVSDIHLEFLPNFKQSKKLQPLWNFEKQCNAKYYLALVGDIGNPYRDSLSQFLELVSPFYEKIYYVPGNHEYYNLDDYDKSKEHIDLKLREICGLFPNVKYFDRQVDYIGNIKIIGTTLWSNIPDHSRRRIKNNINDYHLIKKLDSEGIVVSITVNDTNSWNKSNLDFLTSEIESSERCIVLTHHAPLFSDEENNMYTASPIYYESENDYAFHNDLSDLIKPPIIAWIYGHTHYVNKFEFNGVTVATNQLGYSGDHSSSNFDPEEEIIVSCQ